MDLGGAAVVIAVIVVIVVIVLFQIVFVGRGKSLYMAADTPSEIHTLGLRIHKELGNGKNVFMLPLAPATGGSATKWFDSRPSCDRDPRTGTPTLLQVHPSQSRFDRNPQSAIRRGHIHVVRPVSHEDVVFGWRHRDRFVAEFDFQVKNFLSTPHNKGILVLIMKRFRHGGPGPWGTSARGVCYHDISSYVQESWYVAPNHHVTSGIPSHT